MGTFCPHAEAAAIAWPGAQSSSRKAFKLFIRQAVFRTLSGFSIEPPPVLAQDLERHAHVKIPPA
jgi:hypothetical protein